MKPCHRWEKRESLQEQCPKRFLRGFQSHPLRGDSGGFHSVLVCRFQLVAGSREAPGEQKYCRCAAQATVAFYVEPMKRGVKVPGRLGCCRSGCCRSLGPLLCPLVGGPGAWCRCLVLLSGLVVWAFFWSCSRDLFLPLFLKRGFDPGHRPKNRVSTGTLLLQRCLLTIYLAVGFPVSADPFLSFSLFFLRLLRQMQSHFRRRGFTGNVCCGSVSQKGLPLLDLSGYT